MLQETVIKFKLIKEITVDWPVISSVPVNEHTTRHLFSMAFPWLFPSGCGDVDYFPGKNIGDWGEMFLCYVDGCFASDTVFTFYALNYIT